MFKLQKIYFGDIFSYLCVLFAALVPFTEFYNKIALYLILPLAFLWCFFSYKTIRKNYYIKMLVGLFVWVCVSYIISTDFDLANREMRQILGVFILTYITASLASKPQLLPYLYCVYIFLLISAWIYAYDNILININFGEERLNDGRLNANTLAYYTFFVTIAIFILADILKGKLVLFFRLLFFAVILLSFFTAIYTGSRQVMVIQIPLIAILLWNRYLRGNFKSIVILCLVVVGIIYFYDNFGRDIYENSLLKKRNEIELKEDSRFELIVDALEAGSKSPIFGYGPGHAVTVTKTKHFTHNTFLELFVNTGILGVILYLVMLIRFIFLQFKRYRKYGDRMYFTFLIFGLFFFLDQMFYVFYTGLWLMSFFILVATHAEVYYRKINF
ncbi:MAG: O-antigen ligase family protein [Paludibacteraceae bacterium]|nr:O-antigen ligase family protein [Paludibacteraceae bacterium]